MAVTPNDIPCFLSQCLGGRISDKEQFNSCDAVAFLTKHRIKGIGLFLVMADKGFDIAVLLKIWDVELNHPPFLKKNIQFTAEEVFTAHRITSLRVHVKRAEERVKNDHILDYFPISACSVSSRLVRTFLTVLMPPLVLPEVANVNRDQTDLFD